MLQHTGSFGPNIATEISMICKKCMITTSFVTGRNRQLGSLPLIYIQVQNELKMQQT